MAMHRVRMRTTWSVCQLLSMLIAGATLWYSVQIYSHAAASDHEVLKVCAAFGMVVVPLAMKGLSFSLLIRASAALRIVRRPVVDRVLQFQRQKARPQTRLERIGSALVAIGVVNFLIQVGLSQYAGTYPVAPIQESGVRYWQHHGQFHVVPRSLSQIGYWHGLSIAVTHTLALAGIAFAQFEKWRLRRRK